MIKLDRAFLKRVGLSDLPEVDHDLFLRHVYETLELRVGRHLASRMSDAQLDEFEDFINSKDDAGAFEWLEANFPDYKEATQREFEALSSEITKLAPTILRGDAPHAEPANTANSQV